MALGDTTVIADITQMLDTMLTDAGLDVTKDSPAELKGSAETYAKINLYLYEVIENPHTKNQQWVTTASDPNQQIYPPLGLNLYYLLTPYATDAKSAHSVLGHAMRVFHDSSVIDKEDLPAALRLTTEQLTVSLCNLKLDDLTRIWNSLQTPYRLSVAYEVKIVLVESETQRTVSRVREKKNEFYQK
jgi:hypothetical protein